MLMVRGGLCSAPKRAELLFAAAQLIAAPKEARARDITREMGKVLEEEARRRAGSDRHDLLHGRRRPPPGHGQTVPSELRDKFAMSVRQPLGWCSIIMLMEVSNGDPGRGRLRQRWSVAETVVFKPATPTPLSALNFVKVLGKEAGIPPGCRQPRDGRARRGAS